MHDPEGDARLGIDGGTDVEFGGRRHRAATAPGLSGRTRWWMFAAIAAAVAVVTSVVVVERSHERSARPPAKSVAPSTTTSPVTTAATTGPATTAGVPSTAPSLGPLVANESGWGLFVARSSPETGSQTLKRIDLGSGVVTSLGTVSGGTFNRFNSAVGIGGSGTTASVLTTASFDNVTSAAPGPGDSTWVVSESAASGTPRMLRQVRADAQGVVETIATYDISQLSVEYAYAYGSTQDGTPIFGAFDGSLFSYDPLTRASTRLAKSVGQASVDHGNYSAVECDAAASCVLALHGTAGIVNLIYGVDLTASMSPDGTHALIFGSPYDPGFVHTVDLRTGRDMATTEQYDARSYSSQTVWTPDGSHAVVLNQDHLATISADGTSAVDQPLPSGLSDIDTLIGVA